MRSQFELNLDVLTKAWGGWFDMVQAFKAWLREELPGVNFPVGLFHAAFGCALLLAMATVLSFGTLIAGAFQVWKLSGEFLPSGQNRLQATNELSPHA